MAASRSRSTASRVSLPTRTCDRLVIGYSVFHHRLTAFPGPFVRQAQTGSCEDLKWPRRLILWGVSGVLDLHCFPPFPRRCTSALRRRPRNWAAATLSRHGNRFHNAPASRSAATGALLHPSPAAPATPPSAAVPFVPAVSHHHLLVSVIHALQLARVAAQHIEQPLADDPQELHLAPDPALVRSCCAATD